MSVSCLSALDEARVHIRSLPPTGELASKIDSLEANAALAAIELALHHLLTSLAAHEAAQAGTADDPDTRAALAAE